VAIASIGSIGKGRVMILNTGRLSDGDYGEESLTARFLAAHIFNKYSVVNMQNGKAFCDFGTRCLGLELLPDDMNRATATIEFQTNRSSGEGDKTTFDAMFTIESEWVWGIEVKYFDCLKVEQIQREIGAIERLRKSLGYMHGGVLFIVPEQQLGTIMKGYDGVRKCIGDAMNTSTTRVNVVSWEIIFEILICSGPEDLEKKIVNYCELRNNNSKYPTKLAAQAKVKDHST